ncbi:MAG: UTRA domain-containing protein, partial [Gammaproteobacteria bacterium]|nr:UTRA domain-containing protein [Gammaproteobacteria bacterium]
IINIRRAFGHTRQKGRLRPGCGEQYLSASAASPLVAEQLQMVPGDPVLTLVRHSFDDNGDVVDLLHCQYHPERFHYRMNLSMEDYAG